MQAIMQFNKRGFVVVYHAIPESRINELRHIAMFDDDLSWSSSVLDNEAEEKDRLQSQVPDATSRLLTSTLKRFYKTFFPRSQAKEWRFIKTLAGSKAQPIRREYESTLSEADLVDPCAVPGSVLVATQDNTFLYAFGWNHKVPMMSNRVLVELNKGDMILFRGDLVYKPVGYKRKNFCLQGVLESTDYKRDPDHHPHVLQAVNDAVGQQDPFCFVWRCHFRGKNLESVRRHINRYHHIRFRMHRRRNRASPRSVA